MKCRRQPTTEPTLPFDETQPEDELPPEKRPLP